MRVRHIVIRGLPGSTTFLQIILQAAGFLGKKIIEHNMSFRFL